MRKQTLGVTLLEIMLVLAIAAMIIVMSVRYYQTSSASQGALAALNVVQGITSVADGLSMATNSYAGVTTSAVASVMTSRAMQLPWGSPATITAQSASQYSVSLPNTPKDVCIMLKVRMQANAKFKNLDDNACVAIEDFTYTYDATG